jgi:hypothetical protein
MSDYIRLIGTEDVESAGANMLSAAQDMYKAANSFEDSLYSHRQFMDEWLGRLQQILEDNIK